MLDESKKRPIFPNHLPEMMQRLNLTQADVVKALANAEPDKETHKQTVNKLYHGRVKLSPEWAQRLEPIFGIPWIEILQGPDAGQEAAISPRIPAPATAREKWRDVGSRMAFTRKARMLTDTPKVVAGHLGVGLDELLQYEAGDAPVPIEVAIAFCGEFAVSADFLLLGQADKLDDFLRARLSRQRGDACAPPGAIQTAARFQP
jgi:transcriptional regulator with XRE-family HTH domain